MDVFGLIDEKRGRFRGRANFVLFAGAQISNEPYSLEDGPAAPPAGGRAIP